MKVNLVISEFSQMVTAIIADIYRWEEKASADCLHSQEFICILMRQIYCVIGML